MSKDDLNIDIEGNIIDEEDEKQFDNLIKKAFFRGQRVVLENMIKFINSDIEYIKPDHKLSANNSLILDGMKIAYNKLTKVLEKSIDEIDISEYIENNENDIKRGNG